MLEATYNRYQQLCANGVDTDLGKDASRLVAYDESNGLYAVRVTPGAFGSVGGAGDAWIIPPKAATIGPRDVHHARETFERHCIDYGSNGSWQKMISRIQLYGPVSMECPASIMRLGKGTCYVSESIAAPFRAWDATDDGRTIY